MKVGEEVPVERRLFAQNFRRARLSRKLSQADVSRSIGLDKSYISDIERCNANPTLDVMARLAGAVHTELCELVCGTTSHRPSNHD